MSTENGLKSRIQADINDAVRAGDDLLKSTLRMALAAIMNAEVAGAEAVVLSDDQIINLLRSEVKKRAESADIYEQAGRAESAATERKEMVIIEKYLPAAMDEAALAGIVAEEVANAGDQIEPRDGESLRLVHGRHASGALAGRPPRRPGR